MRSKEITYRFWKAVCWLLLLQMINISVDPPDIKTHVSQGKQPKHQKEIDSINSVYEMVAEGLLDNDIPDEDDETDIEKTVKSVELFCYKTAIPTLAAVDVPLKHQPSNSDPYSSCSTNPNFPPPKMTC